MKNRMATMHIWLPIPYTLTIPYTNQIWKSQPKSAFFFSSPLFSYDATVRNTEYRNSCCYWSFLSFLYLIDYSRQNKICSEWFKLFQLQLYSAKTKKRWTIYMLNSRISKSIANRRKANQTTNKTKKKKENICSHVTPVEVSLSTFYSNRNWNV